MTFSIFDIINLSIILISTFLGLHRGMINILIGIIAFIASIFGAILLYPYLKLALLGHVGNELILDIASAIAAYIISLIITTFISSKITDFFSSQSGGIFDRLLGMGLGFIRGYLIAMVIFAISAVFASGSYIDAESSKEIITNLDSEKYPDWLKSSKVTPYLETAVKVVVIEIPEEWLESIKIPKSIDPKNADEIIDSIHKKKGDARSVIEKISNED